MRSGVTRRSELVVTRRDVARDVSQDVPACVERLSRESLGRRRAARPRVVEVERGAVVDGVRPPVPHEQVGVGPRAVDIGGQSVQPDDALGQVRGRWLGAVVAERAGQEVDAEVGPDGRGEQVLDLLVRLVLRDPRVQGDHGEVGHGHVDGPARPATMISATSTFSPWPAPRNFMT